MGFRHQIPGLPILIVLIAVIPFLLGRSLPGYLFDSIPTCQSHLTTINNKAQLSLMIIFSNKQRKNMAELHGYYVNERKEERMIHRSILFHNSQTPSGTIIHSDNIRRHTDENIEDPELEGLLPGIFRKEGEELTLHIKKVESGNWVFMQSGLPIYYCYTR